MKRRVLLATWLLAGCVAPHELVLPALEHDEGGALIVIETDTGAHAWPMSVSLEMDPLLATERERKLFVFTFGGAADVVRAPRAGVELVEECAGLRLDEARRVLVRDGDVLLPAPLPEEWAELALPKTSLEECLLASGCLSGHRCLERCAPPVVAPPMPPVCPTFMDDVDGACVMPSRTLCPDGSDALFGDGCATTDAACASGRWATPLAGSAVIYVDASAPAGGNGSFASPYTGLEQVPLPFTRGSTIALAGGTYRAPAVINGVTLRGVCASRTRLEAGVLLVYGAERTAMYGLTIAADRVHSDRAWLALDRVRYEGRDGMYVLSSTLSVTRSALTVTGTAGLAMSIEKSRARFESFVLEAPGEVALNDTELTLIDAYTRSNTIHTLRGALEITRFVFESAPEARGDNMIESLLGRLELSDAHLIGHEANDALFCSTGTCVVERVHVRGVNVGFVAAGKGTILLARDLDARETGTFVSNAAGGSGVVGVSEIELERVELKAPKIAVHLEAGTTTIRDLSVTDCARALSLSDEGPNPPNLTLTHFRSSDCDEAIWVEAGTLTLEDGVIERSVTPLRLDDPEVISWAGVAWSEAGTPQDLDGDRLEERCSPTNGRNR